MADARSVNGWGRFTHPLIYQGQSIKNVQLWLEGGRVARFEAKSGREYLETMLAYDEGARASYPIFMITESPHERCR